MQSALQDALKEHFSTALPQPAAATVGGVSAMGFPALDGRILRGAVRVIEAWLKDALNKGLLPTKPELVKIAGQAFDQFAAPLIPGDFFDEAAKFFFLHLVELAYDKYAA